MIEFVAAGNTNKTDAFLNKILHGDPYSGLESFAQRGVDALAAATPRSTGRAASSWKYEIQRGANVTIWWINDDVENGFNVVIGLQYGHGTGNGGWIQGQDFINPALRPIFDEIANDVWKEVQNA